MLLSFTKFSQLCEAYSMDNFVWKLLIIFFDVDKVDVLIFFDLAAKLNNTIRHNFDVKMLN